MSGGPGQIQQSTSLPPWAAKYAKEFLGMGADQFPGGKVPAYPTGMNYQVAGLNPDQEAALGQMRGISGIGAGNLSDTLSGKYLDPNSNPWLKQTADAATQGMVNQYTTATAPSLMAAGIGAGGGGPGSLGGNSGFLQQQAVNQYGLGKNIGDTQAGIYGNAYQSERQNQMGALNNMGAIEAGLLAPGTFEQQQSQSSLDAARKNAVQQVNFPWQELGNFGQLFQSLTGGFSVGSSTNPSATK